MEQSSLLKVSSQHVLSCISERGMGNALKMTMPLVRCFAGLNGIAKQLMLIPIWSSAARGGLLHDAAGFRLFQPSKLQHSSITAVNKKQKVENMGALLSIPLLAVPSMGTVSSSPRSQYPAVALMYSIDHGICCELLRCSYMLCNM